ALGVDLVPRIGRACFVEAGPTAVAPRLDAAVDVDRAMTVEDRLNLAGAAFICADGDHRATAANALGIVARIFAVEAEVDHRSGQTARDRAGRCAEARAGQRGDQRPRGHNRTDTGDQHRAETNQRTGDGTEIRAFVA